MRRLKENFETLTIDFKYVTVIILDGDCAMWRSVDDVVQSLPFTSQFSFTE
jgi:hypothetical protein